MTWFQRHLNRTWVLAYLLSYAVAGVIVVLMYIAYLAEVVGIESTGVAVLVFAISSNIFILVASGWVIHRKGRSLWFVLLSPYLSPLWLENMGETRYDVLVRRKDVDGAIKELEDKSPGVRWHAARALEEIGDKRAVEPLIKALGDKSPIVRWHAARALGEIGDKQAVEPLIEALKGKFKAIYDYKLRMEAARALGEIRDPRAVEPLEKALEDEENKVRKEAKTALNKIRRKSKGKRRR